MFSCFVLWSYEGSMSLSGLVNRLVATPPSTRSTASAKTVYKAFSVTRIVLVTMSKETQEHVHRCYLIRSLHVLLTSKTT